MSKSPIKIAFATSGHVRESDNPFSGQDSVVFDVIQAGKKPGKIVVPKDDAEDFINDTVFEVRGTDHKKIGTTSVIDQDLGGTLGLGQLFQHSSSNIKVDLRAIMLFKANNHRYETTEETHDDVQKVLSQG